LAIIPGQSANEKTVNIFETNNSCSMKISATPIGVYCGESTGSIEVKITGGKAPYMIEWDNNDSSIWEKISTNDDSYTISNLPSGRYLVKVRDANNCHDTKMHIMVDVNASDLQYSIQEDACTFPSEITVNVTGSEAPYWVIYEGPITGAFLAHSNTFQIKDLVTGDYKIILDKDGCGHAKHISIAAPSAPLAMEIDNIDINACDEYGDVQLNITGGTANYTINWAGPSSGFTDSDGTKTIQNLTPGEYIFIIRDANGCSITKTMQIEAKTINLTCALTQKPVLCGNMGEINLSISGGEPDYQVTYTGPASGSVEAVTTDKHSGTAIISNLPAGQYTVHVTDSRGCVASENITVGETGTDMACVVTVNPKICTGNAGVHVTITGGSPNYTISYTGAASGSVSATGGTTFIPLPIGSYNITVTDANGCTATETAVVGQGVNDLHCRLVQTHAICDKNGAIEVIVSGGKPGFTVHYQSGSFEGTVTSDSYNVSFEVPSIGIYDITVTDANGCVVMESTEVKQLDNNLAFEVYAYANTQTEAGRIEVYFQNGAAPYEINLTGPVNTTIHSDGPATFENLAEGLYSVFIKDANGCCKQVYIEIPPQGTVIVGSMRVANQTSESFLAAQKELSMEKIKEENSNPVFDALLNTNKNKEEAFILHQNFPNPFKNNTTISFNLPSSMSVQILVHNSTGQLISYVEKDFDKGFNQYQWTNDDLKSGSLLFCTIRAGKFTKTTRMLRID
jgi:hypothetical protein